MVIVISPPKFGKPAKVIAATILLVLGGVFIFVVMRVASSLDIAFAESDIITIIAYSPVGFVLIVGSFGIGMVLTGIHLIRNATKD